ncbi:aminoglycoside phosphotransferase family protein [Tahibacter amnicola]|uniref:Phosphotransferase n=1 Tax=Tahibacter amnicola TaxID=2976241 RepID=A0ABY6BAU2_9GAMM|nr:phosphotransferase [Tahibacter amnicola]UXI67174.1 phosphotransferase [Tahibacter amnicola]
MDVQSPRFAALREFARTATGVADLPIDVASADASFRSYWRVTTPDGTRILMDSPPALEPVAPWLAIGAQLAQAGLHTPAVFAQDLAQGFLLIEDFGNRPYLAALDDASADTLYGDALRALLLMQTHADSATLEPYDEARLLMEMRLLPEWFLQRHLGYRASVEESTALEAAFETLLQAIREQPPVFVHRDFHSRNLMITDGANPGIIDFQGALRGPLAYDVVSLLRDCYVAWPAARVAHWREQYRRDAVAAGLTDASPDTFARWFDLTGLQRHIKVLGLFCRLCYRDGKQHYLRDLPLVLRYTLEVADIHPALAPLAAVLRRAVAQHDVTLVRHDNSVATP